MPNKINLLQKYSNWRTKRKEKLETKKPLTPKESIISLIKNIVFALIVVMILHGLLIASFIVPTGSMENTVMTGDFLLVNKLFGPSTPQIVPFFNFPLPYYIFPSPKEPQKGDVIVFVFPGNRDEVKSPEFMYYLKRCVGEPGDSLQAIDNVLYVNGEKQPIAPYQRVEPVDRNDPMERFYTFPASKGFTARNYGPIRIPKTGDTISLKTQADYEDWKIFVEREGHKIMWGSKAIIDDNYADYYIVEQDYYFGMGDNRDNSSDSRFWGFIPRKHILGSPIFCWLSWEIYDESGAERNLFEKIANIRWNRIGRCIE